MLADAGQTILPSCGAGVAGVGDVGGAVAATLQFFALTQCMLRESWPKQVDLREHAQFDYIVVGGGAAGAALATRLAENEDVSVLLVEAGDDPPQESIIPAFKHSLKGSRYDWNFTTINDGFSGQALNRGSQRQPRGKMLGGSGSMNDMVYARGFPPDYDEWAAMLGSEWKWPTVLEYFKRTEYFTDERILNDPHLMYYHGLLGEMEVTGSNESSFATHKFMEAFKEMGFDIVQDMTNPTKFGAGRFSHTVRRGHRENSATALLNKSKRRLFVLKNALATKVLIDDSNRAYGVNVLLNSENIEVLTDREVILSAGTFNTPKLLMLSGIGPKQHLKDLGISVVQDLPVGENLHDHVMVLAYVAMESGICTSNETDSYMEVIKYLYDRTGELSKTDTMGAYLTKQGVTDPTAPDFAFYPTCVPKGTPLYDGCAKVLGFKDEVCTKLHEAAKHLEVITIAVVLLKPKSRGRVRLNSKDPLDDPLIYSGTFSDPDDLKGFPEALRVAYSIASTSYFRSKAAFALDLNIEECSALSGVDALRCEARTRATSAWHSVGTAALGTVLDSRLKVKGVSGLRVVDASVMPKVIRGNTFAPVVMIAEMAADFIKADADALYSNPYPS